MNSPKIFVGLIVLVLLGFLASGSFFIVQQSQVALLLRLGKIEDASSKPGLHFKLPLVQNVVLFDKRIQTSDTQPQRFITAEKKFVVVDSYVKWRISDVAQYYRSTGGSVLTTSRLLAEQINTALRNEFGKRTIQEVISGDRAKIMATLSKNADDKASNLGVEIVDVRVKKIDFPERVSNSVYDRMRSERERVAKEWRAQGAEAGERIQADADRQRTEILANAYREAEILSGEGDAKSAEIYANAFNRDSEFYAFWRSLAAYRDVFDEGGSVMVLDPDSEFFRYFSTRQGGR